MSRRPPPSGLAVLLAAWRDWRREWVESLGDPAEIEAASRPVVLELVAAVDARGTQ